MQGVGEHLLTGFRNESPVNFGNDRDSSHSSELRSSSGQAKNASLLGMTKEAATRAAKLTVRDCKIVFDSLERKPGATITTEIFSGSFDLRSPKLAQRSG